MLCCTFHTVEQAYFPGVVSTLPFKASTAQPSSKWTKGKHVISLSLWMLYSIARRGYYIFFRGKKARTAGEYKHLQPNSYSCCLKSIWEEKEVFIVGTFRGKRILSECKVSIYAEFQKAKKIKILIYLYPHIHLKNHLMTFDDIVQGLGNFLGADILASVGHLVSVATTQLSHCIEKALDSTEWVWLCQ